MAEETQGVQNKGLLAVAIILGLIVVVVYNFHIMHIKNAQRGKVQHLLQYTRAIKRGETVGEGDILSVEVPVLAAEAFGRVVSRESRRSIIGKELNQSVRQGQYVMWGHTALGLVETPDGTINKVAVPIEIDANMSPGPLLTADGRVNLVGMFSVNRGPVKSYTIIENVRVVTVGGGVPDTGGEMPGVSLRPQRSYRQIVVELDPEVHLQWLNVLSHIRGPVSIQVLNRDTVPVGRGGVIRSELQSLAERAAGSTSSSSNGRGL